MENRDGGIENDEERKRANRKGEEIAEKEREGESTANVEGAEKRKGRGGKGVCPNTNPDQVKFQAEVFCFGLKSE